MPYVVIDYSKCDGDGACVDHCPISAFEISTDRQWCKPIDIYVRNDEAIAAFNKTVVCHQRPVRYAIRYHVPMCFLCWQCIGACPRRALDVEYDHVETRRYLIPIHATNH